MGKAEVAYLKIKFDKNQQTIGNENEISNDAKYSFLYSINILKGPFPAGENAIATNAMYSFLYSKNVLKGKFSLGEEAMSKSVKYSYLYAKEVLMGEFKLAEDLILESKQYSCAYTKICNGDKKSTEKEDSSEEKIRKNKQLIKKVCTLHNLTIKQLAQELRCPEAAIYKWMSYRTISKKHKTNMQKMLRNRKQRLNAFWKNKEKI